MFSIVKWPQVNTIKIKPINGIISFLDENKELLEKSFKFVEENNGLGLAAPQVNHDGAWFIMRHSKLGLILVLNPVFIGGTSKKQFIEGCFSLPGEPFKVKRYKSIQVDFDFCTKNITNPLNFFSGELSGIDAQIFQHEFLHLKGKCIKDYAT